ncbi:MAG TPA: OmpA family protein [Stellaceae bacterium]|nr:OmpA family protein [Stellaceae bacterium]
MVRLRNKKAQNSATAFLPTRVLLLGASAITLAAGATPALAQSSPTTGFYIGGAAGANIMENNRFRNGGGNSTDSYKLGYAATFALGYGLGNGLRFELEPGYRNNAIDRVNGIRANSRIQQATLMGNVLYDIYQFQTPWLPLTPHVGGGIGYAHVWDRSAAPSGNNVSGDTNRLAFQAIGGLDYALTPNQKIGIDYRYMVVHDASFPTAFGGRSAHAGDLNNHTVLATYRYEFNTPPAPPPPPAQPAAVVTPPPPAPPPAARPYEVYFEFDRSTLTPDARQVVQQAAQNARQGNATQIVATGHTDTVGTASYNLSLSRRRAAAVRAELMRDGVPGNQISTSGVGENDLAIQTGQNVNEPRNRRVEITVRAPGM